ncbi:Gfo/Idh/MocA family protein [Halopiger xanaduensis]|uniref:Oxidoreductase domain protein n=1 Tax=Halopiger xanaduensis (strain DSM 18323 / JCM 14033 / SH-6) TaxID=797210 RepID=F8DDC2_HALXS|nr:Gfo/Idh/MocA family oxidoreductase [Halopiger xanaduensis]AEH39011.1 oxidoreductase domain protein [Halopiger xanaduensis SH-6]
MIRTALLGLGGYGQLLARGLNDNPETTLEAVVDVNPDNLEIAVDEFGVDADACYTDEAAMYNEREFDAAVIATPPAFHRDQIRTAVDHDLHVLCEKPIVGDLEEARDVEAMFADSSQVLMAGYQRHLEPAFIRGRERWAEGDAEPTFMTGELLQDWTDHFEKGTNWRLDPDVGCRGHLFSVGTHVLESLLWMTGLEPESVAADMAFYDDAERIDQRATLSIRFENGAVATMADSAVATTDRERIQIWDDDGALEFTRRDWGEPTLTAIDDAGDDTVPDVDHSSGRGKIEAFVEAITTDAEPPATLEDVIRVTALLDAAYEAARTGERVAVDLE